MGFIGVDSNRSDMRLSKHGDSPSDHYYLLRDEEGKFVSRISNAPSLPKLREVSKSVGNSLERLDVLDYDFECSCCRDTISNRFSATADGKLLCWECAIGQSSKSDGRGVSQTTDPTKAILSESGLYHKNLCNYVINVATGCTHGCKFCYVPSTPNIKARGKMLENRVGVENGQKEWGSYLLYRDDLPERLGRLLKRKRTWKNENGGRGVVMISSGTDCYQDRRAAQITRGCVIELVNHNKPVRILTRSPAVVRDLDVFKAADGLVTVGSSIPCLDDEKVRAIEPGAPAPSARLRALQQISDAGVPVYVSMSPTYPGMEEEDIRELLKKFKSLDPDVIFHEPINPRGANFEMTIQAAHEAGQHDLGIELEALRKRDNWVKYSVEHLEWVREIGEELNLPIHRWPDKELLKYINDPALGDQLREERERDWSPEDYPRPKTPA